MSEKPLAIGGVLRCCAKTLAEYDGPDDDGTVLPCRYCTRGALHVKDGVWQWFRDYEVTP